LAASFQHLLSHLRYRAMSASIFRAADAAISLHSLNIVMAYSFAGVALLEQSGCATSGDRLQLRGCVRDWMSNNVRHM
jgi:hypothetical protein